MVVEGQVQMIVQINHKYLHRPPDFSPTSRLSELRLIANRRWNFCHLLGRSFIPVTLRNSVGVSPLLRFLVPVVLVLD